jgi:hypothetical protein
MIKSFIRKATSLMIIFAILLLLSEFISQMAGMANDSIPADAIYITTADDLVSIGGPSSIDKYYVLAQDINLTSEWIPVDDFKGTLDGNGHVIKNLYILENSKIQYAGLFGRLVKEYFDDRTANVVIKNLGIEIGKQGIVGTRSIGGLVARSCSIAVNNCYVKGNLLGNYYSGSATFNVGGLIGECVGKFNISDSYFDGSISVELNNIIAGGIIGYVTFSSPGSIRNSYTKGELNTSAQKNNCMVGGLVGWMYSSIDIYNSHAFANIKDTSITSNRYIGTLVGYTSGDGILRFHPVCMYSTSNYDVVCFPKGWSIENTIEGLENTRYDSIYNIPTDIQPAVDYPEVPPSNNVTATPSVILNGISLTFDQPPIIESGRTLVPIRTIAEAMGFVVSWNATTQTAAIGIEGVGSENYTGIELVLNIGSTTILKNVYLNGELMITDNLTIDVPAKVVNGRTLVPVRAVAEAFGATVSWDAEIETAIIEYMNSNSAAVSKYQIDNIPETIYSGNKYNFLYGGMHIVSFQTKPMNDGSGGTSVGFGVYNMGASYGTVVVYDAAGNEIVSERKFIKPTRYFPQNGSQLNEFLAEQGVVSLAEGLVTLGDMIAQWFGKRLYTEEDKFVTNLIKNYEFTPVTVNVPKSGSIQITRDVEEDPYLYAFNAIILAFKTASMSAGSSLPETDDWLAKFSDSFLNSLKTEIFKRTMLDFVTAAPAFANGTESEMEIWATQISNLLSDDVFSANLAKIAASAGVDYAWTKAYEFIVPGIKYIFSFSKATNVATMMGGISTSQGTGSVSIQAN